MPRPLPTPPGSALELLWAGVGGTPRGVGPWEAREAPLFASPSAGGMEAAKEARLPAGASGAQGGGRSPQGVLATAVTRPAGTSAFFSPSKPGWILGTTNNFSVSGGN